MENKVDYFQLLELDKKGKFKVVAYVKDWEIARAWLNKNASFKAWRIVYWLS